MDDLQIRSDATDILSYLVEFSPATIQQFVMQEAQQSENVSKSGLEFVEYNTFRANRKITSNIKPKFLCFILFFKKLQKVGNSFHPCE